MVLLSPFPSLVPSFVIETVVTRWCLPLRSRLGDYQREDDLAHPVIEEKKLNRKSSKKQKRAGQGGVVPSLNCIAPSAAESM